MENSNIIVSHQDSKNISQNDLVTLLELYKNRNNEYNANISKDFLVGIINIALCAYPEYLKNLNSQRIWQ